MTASHARLGINDPIYSWKGGAIFWERFIEVCVVHTYSQISTLLLEDHHIGKPFMILYLYDKTCSQKIVYLCLNNLMTIRVETPYLMSNRFRRGDNVQFVRC